MGYHVFTEARADGAQRRGSFETKGEARRCWGPHANGIIANDEGAALEVRSGTTLAVQRLLEKAARDWARAGDASPPPPPPAAAVPARELPASAPSTPKASPPLARAETPAPVEDRSAPRAEDPVPAPSAEALAWGELRRVALALSVSPGVTPRATADAILDALRQASELAGGQTRREAALQNELRVVRAELTAAQGELATARGSIAGLRVELAAVRTPATPTPTPTQHPAAAHSRKARTAPQRPAEETPVGVLWRVIRARSRRAR